MRFCKLLFIRYLRRRKIQGTYFKISALYFKIYGLYFLQHALCFFFSIACPGFSVRNVQPKCPFLRLVWCMQIPKMSEICVETCGIGKSRVRLG